jgi:hypothetical protein
METKILEMVAAPSAQLSPTIFVQIFRPRNLMSVVHLCPCVAMASVVRFSECLVDTFA